MTYLHYLQVECGISTEKVPMALALTHLWWLGSEPNEKQIPSTRTIDASFAQVMAAEDHLFARELEKTLKLRPWVKLSYCFDATKNVKGEQINNLIMTAPRLDVQGYDERAVGGGVGGYGTDGYPLEMPVGRRVVTIDTVVDKSAFGMAFASLSKLENLAKSVDGLSMNGSLQLQSALWSITLHWLRGGNCLNRRRRNWSGVRLVGAVKTKEAWTRILQCESAELHCSTSSLGTVSIRHSSSLMQQLLLLGLAVVQMT